MQYLLDTASSLLVLPMLRDPRFPNVLPEGPEDTIGILAVRVSTRNTRTCKLPTLGLGPRVGSQLAQAICGVGAGSMPGPRPRARM